MITESFASADNPFSTRHTRPGAIGFIFSPGDSAVNLIERLRRNGWQGEIIGPHGAGKSALLATLMPEIERAGRRPVLVELHDGQRRLPPLPDAADVPAVPGGADIPVCQTGQAACGGKSGRRGGRQECLPSLLVVDGYEQLSGWSRWRLKRLCRRRGWGLLVTAHGSVGLPELYRVGVAPDLAQEIVNGLLAGDCPDFRLSRAATEGWSGTVPFVTPAELAECLLRHNGNLRDVLFDLYDLYERRRPLSG